MCVFSHPCSTTCLSPAERGHDGGCAALAQSLPPAAAPRAAAAGAAAGRWRRPTPAGPAGAAGAAPTLLLLHGIEQEEGAQCCDPALPWLFCVSQVAMVLDQMVQHLAACRTCSCAAGRTPVRHSAACLCQHAQLVHATWNVVLQASSSAACLCHHSRAAGAGVQRLEQRAGHPPVKGGPDGPSERVCAQGELGCMMAAWFPTRLSCGGCGCNVGCVASVHAGQRNSQSPDTCRCPIQKVVYVPQTECLRLHLCR